MKLSEYIEILKTFSPDLDVYIPNRDGDFVLAVKPEIWEWGYTEDEDGEYLLLS